MKKKKPFYLNTYLWSILAFAVSFFLFDTNKDLSTGIGLFAVFLFALSVLLSIIKFFKWIFRVQEPNPPMDIPEPVQKPSPIPVEVEPQPIKQRTKMETHKVAGTSFRREAFESIGIPNSDYDMSASEAIEDYDYGDRIYEYVFYAHPALVPEPDNPHDPNAIRVEADGVHIGYIKAGSTAHIRKLMETDRIKSMDIEIGGGRYKQLEENDDERPVLSRDRSEYWARLTIYVSPE